MTKQLMKPIFAFALLFVGFAVSGAAMAQHYGHGYGGYGHGHGGYVRGGGVRFGVSLGLPLYGPGYYPAPYYAYPTPVYGYPAPYAYPAPAYGYPAAGVAFTPPPTYVEQGVAQAAPAPSQVQAQADWFYCAASKSYYPYATECPAGWERVPAQPPSH